MGMQTAPETAPESASQSAPESASQSAPESASQSASQFPADIAFGWLDPGVGRLGTRHLADFVEQRFLSWPCGGHFRRVEDDTP